MREQPLIVYAAEEVLESLKQHILENLGRVQPDSLFSTIVHAPSGYHSRGNIDIEWAVSTLFLPIMWLPAAIFHFDSGVGCLIFDGDTATQDTFLELLKRIGQLGYLTIETATFEAKNLSPDVRAPLQCFAGRGVDE